MTHGGSDWGPHRMGEQRSSLSLSLHFNQRRTREEEECVGEELRFWAAGVEWRGVWGRGVGCL